MTRASRQQLQTLGLSLSLRYWSVVPFLRLLFFPQFESSCSGSKRREEIGRRPDWDLEVGEL